MEERKKVPRCFKGPVVEGMAPSRRWGADTVPIIWHIEQQMMGLEMGSRHTGPTAGRFGKGCFPECDKVRFTTGKIF